MSYNKTTWTAGDTITAEKLNNIENGIEAADKPIYSPEAVTGEGDVSITHNGNQIGVLRDSGTLTLNTGSKVAEHDIGIEYTKPASPVKLIPYTVVDNTANGVSIHHSPICYLHNNILSVAVDAETATPGENAYIIAQLYNVGHGDQGVKLEAIYISSETDAYMVTVNNNSIEYRALIESGYRKFYDVLSDTIPDSITVTISDKAQ